MCATGCCPCIFRVVEARSGDAIADRQDARAACCRLGRQARHRGSPALSPRQLLRHGRPADLRRAARRAQCRDRAVAWLSLGRDCARRPAADHGRRAVGNRDQLWRDLRPDHDRKPASGTCSEDVCDNLFNPDPYYQQGGDMVRVGGLSYTCTPAETVGKRISDLKLDNGHAIEAGRHYKVAGWASVNEQAGAPVWDVVANHLRAGQAAEPAAARRHAAAASKAIRGSRDRDDGLIDHASRDDCGRAADRRRGGRPRAAGSVAGQAILPSTRSCCSSPIMTRAKQGPGHQRRQQPHEILRPRQGRGRTFKSCRFL